MVFWLAIDLIDHNPYQTRTDFNEESLEELADSIAVQGVLQPIVVRPGTEGRFILILGERRLRASKSGGRRSTIPAIVRRVSAQQAAEMTLVENLQRQDLNCVEQAEAFCELEHAVQPYAGGDWRAGGRVAGDGVELHAAAGAAGGRDRGAAEGKVDA
jgi:ParB family chromosome partitioning protein